MEKERVALFFDGANHAQAIKSARVHMDYGKFLDNIQKSYNVIAARYYSGIDNDQKPDAGVRAFLGSLAKKGYVLVTKPIRKFPDGTIKANMDVEIAVDMVTIAPRLDKVLLFTGDGDFKYVVDTIQRMGVFVTLCTHKPLASTELRDQCNEFLELKDIAAPFKPR